MRVMGLDMSTKAGLAVADTTVPGLIVHARTITFPKLTGMERVNALNSEVFEVKEEYAPDILLIEDYAVSKFGGSAITSIEIGTVLRFCLWQQEFPYFDVSPTTLKKFVTGTGKGKKEEMMLHVYKKFGFEAKDNDQADAAGLAIFGLAFMGRISQGAVEHECVKTLRKTYPHWQSVAVNCK